MSDSQILHIKFDKVEETPEAKLFYEILAIIHLWKDRSDIVHNTGSLMISVPIEVNKKIHGQPFTVAINIPMTLSNFHNVHNKGIGNFRKRIGVFATTKKFW